MVGKIKFKGVMKVYLQWPFYLFFFLLAGGVGICYIDVPAGLAAIGLSLLYLLIASLVFTKCRRRYLDELISFATQYGQVQKSLMMDLQVPCALLDTSGRILWMNRGFMEVTGKDKFYRKSICTLFPEVDPAKFPGDSQTYESETQIDDREYRMQIQTVHVDELLDGAQALEVDIRSFSSLMVYLTDVTELNHYIRMNEEGKLISGLVYIDNYEEAMESIDEVRRSLLNALIERRINKYFMAIDAIVKKLEKDKYFVLLQKKSLDVLKEKKFDLLEEVKTVNIGNEMAVTLSIGLGFNASGFAQSAEYARAAIELALGRGGDQVVIKNGSELSFYGGKSQHAEKSTRVKARVKAHALREIMANMDRILVMGHAMPDADALGSSIGIYRAAKYLGKKAHIVIDRITTSTKPMMESFLQDDEYGDDMFVNSDTAKELVDDSTMLVVTDTNRPSYTECEDLLYMVDTIVVLDHHRQGGDVIQNASLSYIEPYASSACEMVAEILQYFDDNIRVRNVEADSLYAGIMVDTDNFQTKTGVRTFEAAAFLRRYGADTTRIRKMFREKLDDYRARGEAISNAELFLNAYAISECPSDGIDSPTIVGAQAANELLNVVGVRASFVLTLFNETVYISARAIDEVNVQIIMERLGGGGHMNVAGAQIRNKTIEEAKMMLKETLQEMINGGDI